MSASSRPAGRSPGDSLLSEELKDRGRRLLRPVVDALLAGGVTPNTVTVVGLLVVLAGSLLVATGDGMLAGAAVLAAGALLDAVDGALARASGGGTTFGAFLDSTLDRIAEAAIYVAIARLGLTMAHNGATTVMLAMTALIGSFLVSYTRARAESYGFAASNGLAPRTERFVILVAGIAIAGLGYLPALDWALAVISILSWATVAQRIWHVRRQASTADKEH